MSTINYPVDNNLIIAENYYSAMLKKDFDTQASYLHPDVHFITPLEQMHGKEPIISAAKNLSHILKGIEIRAKFTSGNQIMFAYDFMLPDPIGKLKASALMEFKNQLIAKIELFYDGRPFKKKENRTTILSSESYSFSHNFSTTKIKAVIAKK